MWTLPEEEKKKEKNLHDVVERVEVEQETFTGDVHSRDGLTGTEVLESNET